MLRHVYERFGCRRKEQVHWKPSAIKKRTDGMHISLLTKSPLGSWSEWRAVLERTKTCRFFKIANAGVSRKNSASKEGEARILNEVLFSLII